MVRVLLIQENLGDDELCAQLIDSYCEREDVEIWLSSCNVQHTKIIDALSTVNLIPPPANLFHRKVESEETLSYCDVLQEQGFHSEASLSVVIRVWQTLYSLLRPDTVLFLRSPSALLAAKNERFEKILVGSGFSCPPPTFPLGVFFPDLLNAEQHRRIRVNEDTVLNAVNQSLSQNSLSPITQLGDIYKIPDKTELHTRKELDHFPERTAQSYLSITFKPCASWKWPENDTKKIYVNLEYYEQLPWLIERLIKSGQNILLQKNNLDNGFINQLTANNISVVNHPISFIDSDNVCDIAITNGDFHTSSMLLLSAVPQIILPVSREQQILARMIAKQGFGLATDGARKENIISALNSLATDNSIKETLHAYLAG